MKRAFLFSLLFASGCWQGPTAEGAYRCSTDSECPPDWVCVTEAGGGRCFSEPGMSGMDGGQRCDGCLDPMSGVCLAGNTSAACGGTGAMCSACNTGQQCVAGGCVERESCGPDDCEGCCDGNACVTDSRDDACGAGGAACMACGSGEVCSDGECVVPSSCNPGNCTGCCDGDVCQTGDADSACGTGGGVCSTCGGSSSCLDGACELPCAERCFGCCDGETCLDGESDIACGYDGNTCETCGSSEVCDGFGCLDRGCSETCGGCCDGDACLSGTLLNACGAGGAMCVDCGAGFLCDSFGCEVDPLSRWDVSVLRAAFPTLDGNGSSWDVGFGDSTLPDARAVLEAQDDGSPISENTSTLDNTVSPNWNERVLSSIRAEDLSEGIRITVLDVDTTTGNDTILICDLSPTSATFSAGTVEVDCVPSPSESTSVAGRVVLQFERS